jgi:hypothetical protein
MPTAARLFRKVVDDPDALIGAFDAAAALMHQMRSKSRRRPKAVTLQQALKSVAMILVFHLSGFDYRKEQASPRARTARMLAALTVVLADAMIPGHPIGPFALMDVVTSRLCLQVQEILHDTYGQRPPARAAETIAAAGYAGGSGQRGWIRESD